MSDVPVKDVSDTAFMVATYRAMESARPDALFRDPLAERLAGEHGRKIVASLPLRHGFFGRWLVVIRTHIIDDFITSAITEGIDTIVNLGAGLDTRPYRMALPPQVRWIEVDFPHMIDFKEQQLREATPVCRLERVRLDLADVAQRQKLFADIAAKSSNVLVLTEGVIPYLDVEAAGALADDLKALPAFRYWIVDYLSAAAHRYRRKMEKKMRMQNAPFRFDPDDTLQFFVRHGWTAKDIRYIGEEAQKLKRPPDLPFVLWLMVKARGLFLGAKQRREDFLKSAAYMLLEPAH